MTAHKPCLTPLQRVLKWGALLLWVGHLLWLGAVWSRLPNRIPTHYGFFGQPDAWGPRSSLLILPIIGTLLYGMLVFVGAFPSLWNTPTPKDPAHAQRIRSLTRSLLLWHTFVLNAIFFTSPSAPLSAGRWGLSSCRCFC